MDIVEYAGLTQEAATLIESFRTSPAESKSDIILRALGPLNSGKSEVADSERFLDLGQGARLRVGETLSLFLSEESKRKRQPEATAEARADGLYLNGKRVAPSKGSYLQPAMLSIQEKRNHRNDRGQIISLSAWRQWHVERAGKLVPVLELKDPALAHKRGR